MAKLNCFDLFKEKFPELHAHLKEKSGGTYEGGIEGKDAYIKAIKELQQNSIDAVQDIYKQLNIQYAISERSAEKATLGETSRDSGEMGEGISQSKEPTRTQEEEKGKATGEEKVGGGEPPPPSDKPKIYVERPKVVLSHRGLQDIANEFSLPDVKSRDRKSDIQLRQDARETTDEWASKGKYAENVERLVKKAEDGEVLTDKDRVILEQHLANVVNEAENMKVTDAGYDAKLSEVKRLKDAGEKTRSEAGAALRIPTGGSRPRNITDAMVEEMDAAGVDVLTDKQKETVAKEWGELEKAKNEFEAYRTKKEQELADREAQAELNKNKPKSAPKTRKTHEDFKAERKAYKEELAAAKREHEEWLKSQGIAKSGIGLSLTTKEAKAIAKIVKSYADEGITKLSEVVEKVYEEIRDILPNVKDTDIRDVIRGAYNEKKPTQTELQQKMYALRKQQAVTDQLDKILKEPEPKGERDKIKRNKRIADLRKQITNLETLNKEERELAQELEKAQKDIAKTVNPQVKALENRKNAIRKEIDEIQGRLDRKDFSEAPPKETVKLDEEGHKLRDKLIKLQQVRDARLLLHQRQNETKRQTALRYVAEAFNVPRTLMTIADFSGLLRQNLFFSAGHPIMTSKATPDMFRSFTSQKVYDRWFADVKETPRYEVIKDSGLAITDSLSHDLSAREEAFMSSLAEKIPVVGQSLKVKGKTVVPGLNIVKGSERSYNMLLNKMRVDVFNYLVDHMEARKKGITFDSDPKVYKAIADYVNNATGRSNFGEKLNRIAPILNSTFFSPRLIASRVNMLTYWAQPRFWSTLPREARVDYFRNWASLLAVGGTILMLAKLAGADVEDDPRSSDFGKIKSGNTRWDVWGGSQQYVRALAQIISGQRKSTNTGEMYDLDEDAIFGSTRMDVATGLLRGKLAPVPASAVDILSGRTSTGDRITYNWGASPEKEVSIGQYIRDRVIPMTISGTNEAIRDRGLRALLDVGVPSTFGIGTQTYETPTPSGGSSNKKSTKPTKSKPQKPTKQ